MTIEKNPSSTRAGADSAKPTPETWPHDRPRPAWAPIELPNAAIEMIEAEQWLAELGVRELVTGLGAGDMHEFRRGLGALRRLLETQFTDGYERGREDTSGPGFAALVAGVAVGAIGASALWVLAILVV